MQDILTNAGDLLGEEARILEPDKGPYHPAP